MRLRARRDGREIDVEVLVRADTATTGDLLAALARAGLETPKLPPGPMAALGLRRGDLVGGARPGPPVPGPVLAVVGGTNAGASVPLPVGRLVVGRDDAGDLVVAHDTVSARHCAVTRHPDGRVEIEDLDSRNGTWVAGEPVLARRELSPGEIVRIGAVLLCLLDVIADRNPAADGLPDHDGTVPLHRPPRDAPPRAVALPTPPPPPERPPSAMPFSVTAVLAPLLLAGVLVLALGNPRYALFALLSPLVAVGSWYESRRRQRRAGSAGGRARAAALAAFRSGLEEARSAEVARRAALAPSPAAALLRARAASVRVWERRPRHADAGTVHLGTATVPWTPDVDGPVPDDVAEALRDLTLVDVAVPVALGPGEVLGIAGDADVSRAVARSLLLQAATHEGPTDLAVELVGGRTPSWAAWLPHVGHGGDRVLTVVDDVAEARRTARPGPVVVLAPTVAELPGSCTTVVELDGTDGMARLRRPADPDDRPLELLVAGVDDDTARTWALALAGFRDGEDPGTAAPAATTVPIGEVVDGLAGGAVPVGADDAGPVLAGDHTVLVSRDADRRTEALVAAAAAAAVVTPPDRLRLVLLPGGAGVLAPLAGLPHVVRLPDTAEAWLGDRPTLVVAEEGVAVPSGLGARVLTAAAAGEGVDLDRPGFRALTGAGAADDASAPVEVHVLDGDAAAPTALDRAVELARTRAAGVVAAPVTTGARRGVRAGSAGLAELLGVDRVEGLDPRATWRHPPADALRAPVGTTAAGATLVLDLKEPAQGGSGPHGLVVGATGSGKSELLRTIVATLAATHAPDELAFVLVDFKGGATFAPLARLPHVAGLVTNLEDDRAIVDRVRIALGAEQRRRQELLREAGDLGSLREHAAARQAGAALEPLPSLLVIVDEFAELLAQEPDFVDVFVSIGRLGRSLGMHLLLASQRLDEGRLRGLESHLGYRICLRTFTAAESRAVLGVADAAHLPAEPGRALLRADVEELIPFRAGMVADDLAALVTALADAAPRAHQVWLPPLPSSVALDPVTGPTIVDDDRGVVAAHWPGVGRLVVPLGVVDVPERQGQRALVADLAGGDANLAVVGAPQSGKSTFLRTLVLGAALTHTPTELAFHAVDYGGGSLQRLGGLPHVGTVATRLDPERCRRVVEELESLLERRQRVFAEHGVADVADLRARRLRGELSEPFGDVVLLVDGWPAFRAAHEDLEDAVTDLAARGPGFGIHVVVTANRWMELRPAIRDALGGRFELRLSDASDSTVDRRAAAMLAGAGPGRLLTADGHQAQTAVVDEAAVVAAVRDSWRGPAFPPVRVLPSKVLLAELEPAPGGVPIGVGGPDLATTAIDFTGADPHLLVLGDGESGKSTLLRTLLAGIVRTGGPEAARIVVVDYRRSLLDAVPADHLLAYAGAAPAAVEGVAAVRALAAARLPGPGVTPEQLRDRSWWTGPELYVVVDDYDLVATPSANPLAPLLDLLAQGRDVGLHLVLARRVAGTSRAAYEPVLQRLRELGSPGVLLSGDRHEGPVLGGHRAGEQPPGRGLLVRARGEAVPIQVACS